MGLKDLVDENRAESGNIETDASDIELDAHDWKYHLAHHPYFGYVISHNNKGGDVPALIVSWYNELIEDGHPSFNMSEEMKSDIEAQKQEIEEAFL